MRTRQHLFRALIADMVADVDETTREVILKIHWQGGEHSQVRIRPGPVITSAMRVFPSSIEKSSAAIRHADEFQRRTELRQTMEYIRCPGC
jgi:hypothetical protein